MAICCNSIIILLIVIIGQCISLCNVKDVYHNMFEGYSSITSKKRTTSEQRTNGPSPKCPLFGGFTVQLYSIVEDS